MTPNTASSPINNESDKAVLAVDLDGTLCRTDTLLEAVLALIARKPWLILSLPFWLRKGRANLKAHIADHCILSAEALPLNEVVLNTVSQARDAGRRTVLVSAADHRQVTALADEVGLFDEAYGTAENQNLKGDTKAHFLIERFGSGGFDYIGDARADLPVWAAARQAITVQASSGLQRAAVNANPNVSHIDPPGSLSAPIFRAMRPHQWSKNLLMFLPALAAHDLNKFGLVLLGFIAFCLAASAVYVINDLLDLDADRAHPRKRERPFASGALSASSGLILASCLLIVALIFATLNGNIAFFAVLLFYLVSTFVYSFWLKRKLVIDVLMLAGLYTIRVFAGAVSAAIFISPWLLVFSMFLFLALAAVKRQAELVDQLQSGRKSSGRAYETGDLPILYSTALAASQLAVLVVALYINSSDVQQLYAEPMILWLLCPILLYWSLRMVMKAHRGTMTDDPIVFAATDPVSLALIVSSAAIVVLATL